MRSLVELYPIGRQQTRLRPQAYALLGLPVGHHDRLSASQRVLTEALSNRAEVGGHLRIDIVHVDRGEHVLKLQRPDAVLIYGQFLGLLLEKRQLLRREVLDLPATRQLLLHDTSLLLLVHRQDLINDRLALSLITN